MLTFEVAPRFLDDLRRLTPSEREKFKAAVAMFVADLTAREKPRPGLRVGRLTTCKGVWRMVSVVTFNYGREVRAGQPHIILRRVGMLDVYGNLYSEATA